MEIAWKRRTVKPCMSTKASSKGVGLTVLDLRSKGMVKNVDSGRRIGDS